jgi:hypothetical protein
LFERSPTECAHKEALPNWAEFHGLRQTDVFSGLHIVELAPGIRFTT